MTEQNVLCCAQKRGRLAQDEEAVKKSSLTILTYGNPGSAAVCCMRAIETCTIAQYRRANFVTIVYKVPLVRKDKSDMDFGRFASNNRYVSTRLTFHPL